MELFRNNCCLLFLFISGFLNSQVEFSSIPVDLQLIPRDINNTGKFVVAGKCLSAAYNEVHSIIKNNASNSVIEDKITLTDVNGEFVISHQVPVVLAEFDLKIYLRNSSGEVLVKTVTRLSCGDYFIIAGQSNGLAAADFGYTGTAQMNAYQTLWNRGIGSHDDPFASTYPCTPQNFGFYQARGDWLQNGFVGTWGLLLQFSLSIQTGVPSCFINGARAGSSISENLASHTPSVKNALDSCTAYDRLYQKVVRHHLDSAIRGMFWYQGESDGALSVTNACAYLNKFHALYTSWKADYPNLEKIFLLQLNTGCNEINLSLLREIQRKISYRYPDVVIMSTFSPDEDDRAADQCHSTIKGYAKIADNLLPVVKKYMYQDIQNEKDILPAKILRVYYSDINQVCLEFDMNVTVQQSKTYIGSDKGTAFIKDYFYGEDYTKLNIVSVSSQNNLVYLNLPADGFKPKKVTYLPHTYSYIPSLYTGPWILNQSNNKLAALSFYDLPITSQSDNNWSKSWSNFGSGEIDGQPIDENSLIYPGDFDGDGVEEFLKIDNNGSMNLYKYQGSQWKIAWRAVADSVLNGDSENSRIYQHKDFLTVGDFDGDGRDELFGSLQTLPGSQTELFKFSGRAWKSAWQGNVFLSSSPKNIYTGDFDGDGKDELLQVRSKPTPATVALKYDGTDFVPVFDEITFSLPLAFYEKDLLPADYNGDGITDLMQTDGSSNVYTCKNKVWEKMMIENGKIAFDQNSDSLTIICGNIDEGKEAEIMSLETIEENQTATFMNLSTGPGKALWQAKQNPRFISSLNDWPLDVLASSGQRFYFIKAVSSEPDYLLAFRKESCGYFASMYKFKDAGNFTIDGVLNKQGDNTDDFLMYPNPTHGLTTLEMYACSTHNISIFSMQGALLMALKDQRNHLVLDLSLLEQGMYFVKAENENGSSVKKVIVK